METLSREYGWTPQQIRNQPAQDIEEYFKIISIRRRLEKAQSNKQKQK